MDQFIGREVGISFPTKHDKRVLYVVDKDNNADWLFVTSEVVSVTVEPGDDNTAEIRVSTRNSEYTFERPTAEYAEDLDENDNVVIVDKEGNEIDSSDCRPGDRVRLLHMPFDYRGNHATGWAYLALSVVDVSGSRRVRGYWKNEYEEE